MNDDNRIEVHATFCSIILRVIFQGRIATAYGFAFLVLGLILVSIRVVDEYLSPPDRAASAISLDCNGSQEGKDTLQGRGCGDQSRE